MDTNIVGAEFRPTTFTPGLVLEWGPDDDYDQPNLAWYTPASGDGGTS